MYTLCNYDVDEENVILTLEEPKVGYDYKSHCNVTYGKNIIEIKIPSYDLAQIMAIVKENYPEV